MADDRIDRIGRIRIDPSPVEMVIGGIGRTGRIRMDSNWIPPPA